MHARGMLGVSSHSCSAPCLSPLVLAPCQRGCSCSGSPVLPPRAEMSSLPGPVTALGVRVVQLKDPPRSFHLTHPSLSPEHARWTECPALQKRIRNTSAGGLLEVVGKLSARNYRRQLVVPLPAGLRWGARALSHPGSCQAPGSFQV